MATTTITGTGGVNGTSGSPSGSNGHAALSFSSAIYSLVPSIDEYLGGAGGKAFGVPPLGAGGNGGDGALFSSAASGSTLTNAGTVAGGAGGYGDIAGAGGIGVYFAAADLLTNNNGAVIHGGAGGGGGFYTAGGSGGVGVKLDNGGSLSDAGQIAGGGGGAGGHGPVFTSAGGLGGAGGSAVELVLDGMVTVSSTGTITGGMGGTGGTSYGSAPGLGGKGGAAILLDHGGTLSNAGRIIGGTGGGGGLISTQERAGGGASGAGVNFVQGGTLFNDYYIVGGPAQMNGSGGAGVLVGAATGILIVNNSNGIIKGGSDSNAGDTDRGAIGVDLVAGGTLTNAGAIIGGYSPYARGDAVYFGAGESRLIVKPGASFTGNVVTTGLSNVLELATGAGIGAIVNIGRQFYGFQTVEVDSGSTWNMTGLTFNYGTIIDQGSLIATGGISGTGVIQIDLATLTLNDPVGNGQTIEFLATGNTLKLGDVSNFAGTISGFAAGPGGDTLDLTSIALSHVTAANFNSLTGVLTVVDPTDGNLTFDFANPSSLGSDFFHITDDGSTGIDLTCNTTPCYCPGTMILTAGGEVAVENLAIGDLVVTLSGEYQSIRWLGKRGYAGRFLAGKKHILPVRIKTGALSEGLPRRDLVISPLHAMYIDGVLIPAGELVNGVSIVQEEVDQVDYIHIELANHDVIWAEGAASETFIDDDSRMMFHNAQEFFELYPDSARPQAQYCAPRLTEGYELEAIRMRLAEHAAVMWTLGSESSARHHSIADTRGSPGRNRSAPRALVRPL